MADKRDQVEALYPASEKQQDRLTTPGGHTLSDLTLPNVLAGRLGTGDLGISPDALRLQRDVAEATGRSCLAENFERGAELTGVSQDEIFATYNLLRPGRAESKQVLLDLARRYRDEHDAPEIAGLIEDAAEAYERRGLFRTRY